MARVVGDYVYRSELSFFRSLGDREHAPDYCAYDRASVMAMRHYRIARAADLRSLPQDLLTSIADPNPANFGVTPDGRVVILDGGATDVAPSRAAVTRSIESLQPSRSLVGMPVRGRSKGLGMSILGF